MTASVATTMLRSASDPKINMTPPNLPSLTPEQQLLVNKAKKYAMDITDKAAPKKQIPSNQQQQQKALQRHQALVLMCRVYVGSISFELKEETIKAAFAPYGAIKSINMSWDPTSLKHKGFAFVEYELPEAAQLALEHMNGIQLGGRQIKVGRPSNMPQAAPIIQQIQEECKEKNRIYVSNIHSDLQEQELINIFDPFGKILTCKLALTPNVDAAQHRGYGFIEYDSEAAATEALTMNDFDLGGQVLHVCRATTPAENLSIHGTLDSEAAQASSAAEVTSEEEIQRQLEQANKEQERVDREQDAEHRHRSRRSRTTHESSRHSSSTNGHDESISNVIVLRNMVEPDEELDDSLQLDVYEECGKHGTVTQVVIYVDKKTKNDPQDPNQLLDEIKIFVKYKDRSASSRARQALNGRFFAGRKVTADHYDWNAFRMSDYSK